MVFGMTNLIMKQKTKECNRRIDEDRLYTTCTHLHLAYFIRRKSTNL